MKAQRFNFREWGDPLSIDYSEKFGGDTALSKITESVERLAAPIAERLGLEIWDIEYVKEAGENYLRIYIDRENGVDIDDCEAMSRAIDPELDRVDPIPDSYILEVSSAGIERVLKRQSDFDRFVGSDVLLRFFKPINGAKEVVGKLLGLKDDLIGVETPAGVLEVSRKDTALCRLYVKF